MRATVSSTHHHMRWVPETRLGQWSIALAGVGLGGTLLTALAFALGVEPADSFSDNWWLNATGASILAAGVASLVTGGIALRRHDHSWLVVLATGVGALTTAVVLQQVAEGLGWLSA